MKRMLMIMTMMRNDGNQNLYLSAPLLTDSSFVPGFSFHSQNLVFPYDHNDSEETQNSSSWRKDNYCIILESYGHESIFFQEK